MNTKALWFALAGALTVPAVSSIAQITYGPTPYSSLADSPFTGVSGFHYFYAEDFEDTTYTPGWSVTESWLRRGPSVWTDSVDGDDGTLDGSGTGGGAFFSQGATTLTVTFDQATLTDLPTDVGIVWTDVGIRTQGGFTVEAFDASDVSLGVIGPALLGDAVFNGTTAEDSFFGFTYENGISRLVVTSLNSGLWEVDHLQYGHRSFDNVPIPEPSTYGLLGGALLAAMVGWRRFRRDRSSRQ